MGVLRILHLESEWFDFEAIYIFLNIRWNYKGYIGWNTIVHIFYRWYGIGWREKSMKMNGRIEKFGKVVERNDKGLVWVKQNIESMISVIENTEFIEWQIKKLSWDVIGEVERLRSI